MMVNNDFKTFIEQAIESFKQGTITEVEGSVQLFSS
jgi:hypothetical protein